MELRSPDSPSDDGSQPPPRSPGVHSSPGEPGPAFSRSPLAQALVSRAGLVLEVNAALEHLAGAPADELVGTPLARWFRHGALGANELDTLARGTQPGAPLALQLERAVGPLRAVRLHAAPSSDAAAPTWIALELAEAAAPPARAPQPPPLDPAHRHELVLASLPLVFWGIDGEGTFRFSEGKALESLGLQPGEVVGGNVFELYADAPDVLRSIERALAGEAHFSVTQVGERVWYTRYAPSSAGDSITGKATRSGATAAGSEGVVGVSIDITEHDRAEAELREVRDHLHSVVTAAPVLLWATDSDGRLSLVEGLGLERVGARPDDLLGKSIEELGSPLLQIERALEDVISGRQQTLVTESDGQTWENRFRPRLDANGEVSGIVGVSVDVSDRASAERALEESRADRDALLECTHQMIFSLDREQRLVSWNSAWAGAMQEWLQFEPVAGMPLIGPAQDPVKRERWRSWYERALGGKRFQVDYVIDVDGGMRHFEVSFTPIVERDAAGQPTGVVRGATCFMNDISPRKHAENALRESEEHLRAILDSVAEGVIATDADERVVAMNPVAEHMTGWRSADAHGTPLDQLFVALDPATRAPQSAPEQLSALPHDVLLVARDGSESQVAVSLTALRDVRGARRGSVLVLRDRSEEAAAEEALRQGQKMEAVGQLAAGIAHDFNNLLAGIMGHAELLEDRLAHDPQAGRHLLQIRESSSRAADLTAQLLSFSRKHPLRRKSVDVHGILEDAVRLLEHSVDRLIVLRRDFGAPRARVLGDPTQLQSAFLNLGVNARDALPAGGEIRFTTRTLTLGSAAPQILSKLGAPGEYLEVRVQDTGVGMDPATLERIFEPFFTTKPEGQGTGLGLAGAYGCVEQHGGVIEVESEPGTGSTFRVILPLAPEVAESFEILTTPESPGTPRSTAAVDASAAQSGSAAGHVLVIDDEQTVRNLTRSALALSGYTVSVAEDGEAGVEALRNAELPVDLVILDMVMPKSSGEATFRLLREVDPELPILLVSGFSNSRSCNDLLREGALGLLSKPFRIEELRKRVRAGIASRAEH